MKTILGRGSAEQTIEKSRFIAYACPVESREEAEAFIAEIRGRHRDATHNVPAMVIGQRMEVQWGSDDGEPGGTSGTPMVQMMANEGITNVCVVVTRYFGGIKLGPGGLVRAYTSSCKLGLEAAGLCEIREMAKLTVAIDYSYLAKIQSLAKSTSGDSPVKFEIGQITYEDKVTIELITEVGGKDALINLLNNLMGGNVNIVSDENVMSKVAI